MTELIKIIQFIMAYESISKEKILNDQKLNEKWIKKFNSTIGIY